MTINEAKISIAKMFIDKYLEWLEDYNQMEELPYSKKYGWGKNSEPMKDTQKSMVWFQSNIFSGKYIDGWKKDGFDLQMLVMLHREGFFSYDYCSSWKARQLGKTNFYYINQNKAKEIYKAYKNGFFKVQGIA